MNSLESLHNQIINLNTDIQNCNKRIEQHTRLFQDLKTGISLALSQTTCINEWIFLKFGVHLNEEIEDVVINQDGLHDKVQEHHPSILESKENSESDEDEPNKSQNNSVQSVNENSDENTEQDLREILLDERESNQNDTNQEVINLLYSQSASNIPNEDASTLKGPKRGRPKKEGSDSKERKRLPVQCDQCGKILKGEASLKSHKLIHTNIRPWECNLCSKKFRRKHHLDFHILIHEGDKGKTKMCHFCSKSFFVERDLNRHVRTHTREKPFECHICPKSFNIKQHLILHLRTHTGEKPYKCDICGKTYSQANSLRLHKKIHLRKLQGDERTNDSSTAT